MWIDETINILDSHNYLFKKISTETVNKKEPETTPSQVPVENKEEKEEKKNKQFIAPKTDLYGVYLKEKQKIIIEELA